MTQHYLRFELLAVIFFVFQSLLMIDSELAKLRAVDGLTQATPITAARQVPNFIEIICPNEVEMQTIGRTSAKSATDRRTRAGPWRTQSGPSQHDEPGKLGLLT